MNYLLYCILQRPFKSEGESLLGVGNQPVTLLHQSGLSAAVSRIESPDLTPNIPRLRAYQKVVESLFSHHTVIPMRYGCLFEEESQVRRTLQEHGEEYRTLLAEMEGCVEMGIRILIADCGLRKVECHTNPSKSEVQNQKSEICNPSPGHQYLMLRKAEYAEEERFSKKYIGVMEKIAAAFAGLFVKCKREIPATRNLHFATPNSLLLSLYFLVSRDSVVPFQKVFGEISLEESIRLLLSGPWPPYNFVLSGQFQKGGQWNRKG